MSLPPSQLRTLEAIEQRLRAREPRLASMFAIFTRLSQDEKLPHRETIDEQRRSPVAALSRWLRRTSYYGQLSRYDQVATFAAVAVVPLMLIAAISTVVVLAVHR